MWQKYTQLSHQERCILYDLLQEKYTNRQIAEILERSPSTITRELKRNKTKIRYSHKTNLKFHYLPDSAQTLKTERRKKANYRTPLKNEIVKDFVFSKLKENWSPDIISWVLKKTYGKCQKYNISHETIYKFIYSEEWELQKLKYYLTRKHKTRRKYSGHKTQKLPKIPNPTSIHERKNIFPKSETRQEFWHYEGDSILSLRWTYSAIHTEVERKTRFIFAQKINKKSAENVEFATIQIFSEILEKTENKNAIKSTTWDNGTEHANHEKVAKNLNIKIFFADPYKSWQRGTNEVLNGMIRRYLPKWTNFDKITQEQLQEIIDEINNRPRKIFWYKTSKEMWDEEIKKLAKNNKKSKKKIKH